MGSHAKSDSEETSQAPFIEMSSVCLLPNHDAPQRDAVQETRVQMALPMNNLEENKGPTVPILMNNSGQEIQKSKPRAKNQLPRHAPTRKRRIAKPTKTQPQLAQSRKMHLSFTKRKYKQSSRYSTVQPNGSSRPHVLKNRKQVAFLRSEWNKDQQFDANRIIQIANKLKMPRRKVYKWVWDRKKEVELITTQKD